MSDKWSSDQVSVVSVQGIVSVQVGSGKWVALRPGVVIRPGKQRVRIYSDQGGGATVGFGGQGVTAIGQLTLLTIEWEAKGNDVTPKVTTSFVGSPLWPGLGLPGIPVKGLKNLAGVL
jgi:hypothetical protein